MAAFPFPLIFPEAQNFGPTIRYHRPPVPEARPTGSLEIIIDTPGGSEKTYGPGDRIEGRVIYQLAGSQENIEKITVVLQAKATSRSGPDPSTNAGLFKEGRMLLRGPFTVAHQRLEKTFGFNFPSTYSNYSGSGLPLPPSVEPFEPNPNGVGVQYSLRATVGYVSPLRPSIRAITPLVFRPWYGHPYYPRVSEPRVVKLSPITTETPQPLQRLLPFRGTRATDSVLFNSEIELPRQIWMGQRTKIRVRTKLIGDEKPEADTQLTMRSVSLKLRGTLASHHSREVSMPSQTGEVQLTSTARVSHGSETIVTSNFGLQSFQSSLTPQPYIPDFEIHHLPLLKQSHVIEAEVSFVDEQSGRVFNLRCESPITVLDRLEEVLPPYSPVDPADQEGPPVYSGRRPEATGDNPLSGAGAPT